MKKNHAISVGAVVCGATLLLGGCGDDPAQNTGESTNSAMTAAPVARPGTLQPGTAVSPGGPAGAGGSVPTTPAGGAGPVSSPPGGGAPAVAAGGAMPAAGGMAPAGPVVGAGAMPATPAAGAGAALVPTTTGWVAAATNTVGIQGAWYPYNDCSTSPGDCTTNHLPPSDGTGFANVGGKMCTSGTTAQVLAGEYATKWGAGIALDLNTMAGALPGAAKMPWNATAAGAKGISFTLELNVPGTVRVNLPTAAGGDAHFANVMTPGPVSLTWDMFAQGSWVTTPVALDPSQLLSIQFQIPSADTGSVPFDFCISDLAVLL